MDFKKVQQPELVFDFDKKEAITLVATGATAGVITLELLAGSARADGVADINAMVSSLGTIAGTVTTVVLGAMVVRMGIKFVNRMTVKG